jgi:hypothetical protein
LGLPRHPVGEHDLGFETVEARGCRIVLWGGAGELFGAGDVGHFGSFRATFLTIYARALAYNLIGNNFSVPLCQ